MRSLFVLSTALLFQTLAYADGMATVVCRGNDITLTAKTPYLGEDLQDISQTLYTLKEDNNDNESAYTAYFLNVSERKGTRRQEALITTGKNGKGGSFTLKTKAWKDISDGGIIDQITEGTLTYSHGPIQGENVAVKCTKN